MAAPGWACRLVHVIHNCAGHESRGELCDFQILIVSAVKISKQCLQTALTSSPDPYRCFTPGLRGGTSLLSYSLPK